MRLPNFRRALVEPGKVRGYLLSNSHPVGRFKSGFFMSLGYTQDDWMKLRDDLVELAANGAAIPVGETKFGRKFEVTGILTGPTGRSANIRTVWMVASDGAAPRFITAYPR